MLWLIKGLGPGGAEELLASSAQVADHDAFQYRAAYVRPDKDRLVPRLEANHVPTTLIGAGRLGGYLWPLRLRPLMAGADVVHAHSPLLAGAARLVNLTLPPARRPVLVSTEHNLWPRFGTATRWLNGLTANLDAQRWAVSNEVVKSMWPSRRAGADVLVHGIVPASSPPEGTRERVRREQGVDDRAVVAMSVGNYRVQKDYPNLLRAARIALDHVPNLVFWIVGQGPLEEEVKALHVELGLGDRVRLLGYRADVRDLLQGADLFCLGSQHEGLPVAIMEAMAAGLPIVATAVGGVGEAVTDGVNGRLVPAHDAELLGAAIADVAGDDGSRSSFAAASRSMSERFDISIAVATQQAAYRGLVKA